MAEIRRYPWIHHLRSEPTAHILHYKHGKRVASGRGLTFFFLPMNSAVAEIPTATHELPFLIQTRSRDHQEVAVQGEISYHVVNAERLGDCIDFSIDLRTGRYLKEPLSQIASLLIGQCQQAASEHVATETVRDLLAAGPTILRSTLAAAVQSSEAITQMGIAVQALRVVAVRPTPELEKALQTPTRERMQQEADQATFERRALAVEKERAIADNELINQIELARRESTLIEQQGLNGRRQAEEVAAARAIEVDANASATRVDAEAQADRIRLVDGARVVAERERIEIYRALPPAVIIGLAAQELAQKLTSIEHLNVTPDLLAAGLNNLLSKGLGAKGD